MFSHTFLVCPLSTEAAGLFDIDFLVRTGAEINIDPEKNVISRH
jgi:hypothetical protein